MPRRGSVTGLFSPMSGLGRKRFNNATGGTVTEVANYNGSGETWRVHTFTSGGTFTVTSSTGDFRYLVTAGGGGGGIVEIYGHATGSGGAGGVLAWDQAGSSGALTLSNISYAIGVGGGGGGNGSGGSSSISSLVVATGGGHGGQYGGGGASGGSGGGGGYGGGFPVPSIPGGSGISGPPRQGYGGSGGPGGVGGSLNYQSSISGANLGYGGGSSGRGNGGAGSSSGSPGAGSSGTVIIAYRII